jgi:hypothetical protein
VQTIKEKYAATGGWYWTTTWSSFAVFKGTFNNGAKEAITSSLTEVSHMIQNAIDFLFPPAIHPIAHAVFTEQLLISRQQAFGWIKALKPLYEILSVAGMASDEAWEIFLIFTKAIFDDVWTVRALTLDRKNTGGMIWGSFCTTKLLAEYQRLKFYQHPHVSNMLVLTSLQREGKKVRKAVSTLGALAKLVEMHQSKIVQIKKELKGLKKEKLEAMEQGEIPASMPVLRFWNDGDPTPSVATVEAHAVISQTEVGRRARSKVRTRIVGSHSLGWVDVFEQWGAEVEAVVVSSLDHYKDIRQLVLTTPKTASDLAFDLPPSGPWDGCLAANLLTCEDVRLTSTLFN